MGRPRLYHTIKEKSQAKQTYSKTYYTKNHERISLRNKEKYRLRLGLSADTSNGSPIPLKPTLTPRRKYLTCRSLEAALMSFLKNSLASFLDNLISDFLCSPIASKFVDQLTQSLETAEELRVLARSLHAQVLQSHGVCTRLNKVEASSRRIAQVVHALEDLLLHVQSEDLEGFVDIYCSKQFSYQTAPDVVPLPEM
ncbi:hypothetical protein L210DRAFT_876301 [Boletus edulis BED1]|uniref:Uncharacterized protein n=1 Tax=Boletus edulis BED1 TaxID=1328754 RepID=A0AAD4B9Q2_BOLED|nr:hypothetical protein L210DRAFT_876301 [Boletus edulis BED1]